MSRSVSINQSNLPASLSAFISRQTALLCLPTFFISLFLVLPIARAANAPVIFFSDLESGPKTGGENNNGAFVTVYGRNFGTSPGSVTVGGGQATNLKIWTDTKVAFQLGPGAATGNIVVSSVGNGSSNGVPFVVRPGTLRFVAKNGSDANSGLWGSPWATLQHAHDTMVAGDITYAMDGVVEGSAPNGNGNLVINASGQPGQPLAIVAYPSAVVTVGGTGSSQCLVDPCWVGIRNGGALPQPAYWVFAGLNVRGQELAVNFEGDESQTNGVPHDIRWVANDVSCPWGGTQQAACFTMGFSQNIKFYGNAVHDVSTSNYQNAQSEYHGLYFTSHSLHLEIGWNQVYNIAACIGMQFHSTAAYNMYDIKIHDNLIHDTRCDGILIATVSPELGPISIFNNIIYNAGGGWPFGGPLPQGGGDLACIYVTGGTQAGPDTNGTVPLEIYNNTLYNCGSGTVPTGAGFTPSGISLGNYSPLLKLRLRNNIIYNRNNVSYTIDYNQLFPSIPGQPVVNLIGDHDLLFGSGGSTNPAGFTAIITGDPLFVNLTGHDFHLQPGSPAKDAGVTTPATMDFDGIPRPQGPAYDIGAFELIPVSPPSPCDVNGDGVVDAQDVQLEINMALGLVPCSNPSRQCTIVQIQRVVNAILGGACLSL